MWIEQGRIEPVMPGQANTEWIIAMMQSATKAGALNAKAALWTAVAIVLSTAASVVSLI
jgi:hypothetical protein